MQAKARGSAEWNLVRKCTALTCHRRSVYRPRYRHSIRPAAPALRSEFDSHPLAQYDAGGGVSAFFARDTVTTFAPPLLRFARSSTRIRSLGMTRAYKQMQCPMRQKGDVKKRSFFTSPEGNNFIVFEELSAEVQKPKHQTKASCFCSCVCERTSVCACSCSESSASRAFASMSFTLFS